MYQPSPVTRRASLVAARRFFGAGRFYFRGGYFFLAGGLFFARGAFFGAPLFFFSSGFFSILRGKIFRSSARLYGAQKNLDARRGSYHHADRRSARITTRIAARHASQPPRPSTPDRQPASQTPRYHTQTRRQTRHTPKSAQPALLVLKDVSFILANGAERIEEVIVPPPDVA